MSHQKTDSILFADKIKFSNSKRVVTYSGKDLLGIDFFCYILCGIEGYKKMQRDFSSNNLALLDSYGEIIYKDYIISSDKKAKNFLQTWAEDNNAK